MIDLVNSEARHVAILHRHMMKRLDQELAPLNLGHGRYLYLFALYIHGARKQQELADIIGADKAAAARALARLEVDGYIRREPDERDRRATRVHLSAKGRDLQLRLEQAAATTSESFTVALDDAERSEFKRLLAKIAAPLAGKADGATSG